MCGIAGWYRRSGRAVSSAVVKRQCDTIYARGPDDYGVLTDGDFGFGMRRLILGSEGRESISLGHPSADSVMPSPRLCSAPRDG